MKRKLLVAILFAALVSASSFGQTPQAGSQPTRIISGTAATDLKRIPLSRLSLEEQAKLRSAHETAMRDPALIQSRARYEQARKEFRDKLRDALLKADPSVQPILDKAQSQHTQQNQQPQQQQRHRDR